ncbi:hypothetical protein RCL1_004581 [Eukaryota sp. TZLM3-RCL]
MPPRLTSQQERVVNEFMKVTQANRQQALNYLLEENFRLNDALDEFFAHSKPVEQIDLTEMERLFDQYKDPNPNIETPTITFTGFQELAETVQVPPGDIRWLIFLWKASAKTMGAVTRDEFLEGCRVFKSINLPHFQQKLADATELITSPDAFRSFYKWLFNYLKEDPSHKSIALDNAELAWRMVLLDKWDWLEDFIEFLRSQTKVKNINSDLWNQLYSFITVVGTNLSIYSSDDAWPTVIDSFVEWKKTKM